MSGKIAHLAQVYEDVLCQQALFEVEHIGVGGSPEKYLILGSEWSVKEQSEPSNCQDAPIRLKFTFGEMFQKWGDYFVFVSLNFRCASSWP
ncbi:MAG: hypothetical protein K5945_06500 [Bacteroidaceae bacterium]|nr:hypothetical protein [Bacteroidaceae bacterium]